MASTGAPEVVQVLNPAAWALPFVQRAIRSIKTAPDDIDFAAILDAYEVWLALAPEPAALAILSFAMGPLKDIPSVVHFHCEGDSAARGALVAQVVRRIKEAGYTRFLAGNWSGRGDDAWVRMFRDGGRFEMVGSTFVADIP